MIDLKALVQSLPVGENLKSLAGLRHIIRYIQDTYADTHGTYKLSLAQDLFKQLGFLCVPQEEQTPQGIPITLLRVLVGPENQDMQYAVLDVERGIIFTAPSLAGKGFASFSELYSYPDWVASERQPDLPNGETYTEFFSHGPRSICFYIGDKCNAKCVMCWQAKRRESQARDRNRPELATEVVESSLERYGHTLSGVELISFGEPLLHPDFDKMVDAVALARNRPDRRYANLTLNVTTNGSLLDRHPALLLQPGYLTFSIDAAEKAVYERIRVGLKWESVLRNFKFACANKKFRRTVGVNLTVFEDNLDQIIPMAQLCSESGADYLSVLFGDNLKSSAASGRGLLRTDPRLCENIDKAQELFPNLKIHDKATNRKPKYVPEPKITQPRRSFCPLPWRQIDIGTDGYAHPCCHSHHTNLGHILTDDVWRGEPYRELRRQILSDEVDPIRFKDCANCTHLGAGITSL